MTIPVKELLTAMESIPEIVAKAEQDRTLAECIVLAVYATGRAAYALEHLRAAQARKAEAVSA